MGRCSRNRPEFLEVAYRAPRGTLCLVTALARHGLTDIIPDRIDVAVREAVGFPPCTHRSMSTFLPARRSISGAKNSTLARRSSSGCTQAERSLIDIIRLRHREGSDIAWEALRRWLRRKGSAPAALVKMAKHFHGAERAVRNALEVVQ